MAHGLLSQWASPPVHLAIPPCCPSGWFLLFHHPLTMPFCWKLLLTPSPGCSPIPPPLWKVEGQQVARQYLGLRPQWLSSSSWPPSACQPYGFGNFKFAPL